MPGGMQGDLGEHRGHEFPDAAVLPLPDLRHLLPALPGRREVTLS
jgi:hypothetical protein